MSIYLRRCINLVEVPNLSHCSNMVSIDLNGCEKLVEVPLYLECLHKLTYLNLGNCWRLRSVPEIPSNMEFLDLGGTRISKLPSSVWSLERLVELNLDQCSWIYSLPNKTWRLNSLTHLDLGQSSIRRLPPSIECLSQTVSIRLQHCRNLKSISPCIWKLKCLKELDLRCCSDFQDFPEILEPMECLEK